MCVCVCVYEWGGGGGGGGIRVEAGRGCDVYAIPVYHLTKRVMLRRYSFNEKGTFVATSDRKEITQ